ncbi:MAG: diguanylate cyclase [Pseudomonadota bacterium]|nr:diguanylate cyclase [Pseudomonadota bacterium]
MAVQRADSERLRDSFADVLRTQALEVSQLASLAGEDPDVRDAVAEMLERVQKTARSLNLEQIEEVAADAARAMEGGAGGEALLPLLEACRALDPTAEALRRILVVGAPAGPTAGDPLLKLVPTVAAALEEARQETPLAVILPISAFEAGDTRGFGDVPRYAWGDGDDLACRLAAARTGALAYFAAPLDLRTLAARVRARALSSRDPDRVLLVGPSERVVANWVRALADLPVELTVLRARDRMLATLEELDPALVVLADPRAPELAMVLRGHPDWWDLPRVVVADEPPLGLVELTLSSTLPMDRLRAQGMALLERARQDTELRAVERTTGVLPRVALLRAAEREAAIARRTRQALAVARIDIDEPASLRRTHGNAAVSAAVRLLARALGDALRNTDIVGRVGEHGFGVLLPGTSAAAVRPRLHEVERRFLARIASDPRLAGVTASAGLADLDDGPEGIFQRADLDRVRARRGT